MGDFDALANGNTSTKPRLISCGLIILLRLFSLESNNAVRCFFFGRNFKGFGALSRFVVGWLCLQMSECSKVAKSCFVAMIDVLNESIKAVIVVTIHDGDFGGGVARCAGGDPSADQDAERCRRWLSRRLNHPLCQLSAALTASDRHRPR